MINLCRDCLCYMPYKKTCAYWGDYAGPAVISCQGRKPKTGSYISRAKLEQWLLTEMVSLDTDADKECAVERIKDDIPDADVIPARRGTWIVDASPDKYHCNKYLCNLCGYEVEGDKTYFCPGCGADMRGDFDEP